MVGCVIAQSDRVVGEGWHERFGGPHAEVNALRSAGAAAAGATLYVTLEPCCHHGKTPPCTEAVIQAGITRVVIAQLDPYGKVQGQGIRRLREAGLQVEVGLLEAAARRLNAPYLKLLATASPLGDRQMGHDARWQDRLAPGAQPMDLVGRVAANRASAARPRRCDSWSAAKPRGSTIRCSPPDRRDLAPPRGSSSTRLASLPLTSQLVRTAYAAPVIVAVGGMATAEQPCDRLRERGCEVLVCEGANHLDRLNFLTRRTRTTELDQRAGRRGWRAARQPAATGADRRSPRLYRPQTDRRRRSHIADRRHGVWRFDRPCDCCWINSTCNRSATTSTSRAPSCDRGPIPRRRR